MVSPQEIIAILRFTTIIPLLFITYQVVALRRYLMSPAWTLLMSGFLVFAVLALTLLAGFAYPILRLILSLVGYGLIAAGFHALRRDIIRVIRPMRRVGDK